MIDFEPTEHQSDLRDRTVAFVRDQSGAHQLMLFETEKFSTSVHEFCPRVIEGG